MAPAPVLPIDRSEAYRNKGAPLSPAPDRGTSIFSVDVEDWFHILDVPSTPALAVWDSLPSRVEANFHHLLDLFSQKRVRVTCFFLGWVGERFPQLVREAVSRGHEIGSHGYAHRLVYQMTREQFREDALRSRMLLEDIGGVPVHGYRSAGFSTTEQTPWFFDELVAVGYQYDSSVFPATREHGGMRTASRLPHIAGDGGRPIIEFPITVANIGFRNMCFFGGGYLRLFPYWLIRRMARRVLNAGLPVVFYVHPREIDPSHPRLPMSLRRRFKSYVNLRHTEDKIRRILDEFPVTTFQRFLTRCGHRWSLDHAAPKLDVASEQRRLLPALVNAGKF
jgi:polysaccharide deacetylase family protein (PEP-CTERM system associated)